MVSRSQRAGERAQASVELLAVVPLLLALALAALQAVMLADEAVQAQAAAGAAAAALERGEPPLAAARRQVRPGLRPGLELVLGQGVVRVSLAPSRLVPGVPLPRIGATA